LIAFLVLIIVRNAWLSDDAYISFRSVDNFVNGRGLTWNPGQRVQAFTHPAWFFVVSAAYALTGEMYYTAIALSVLVSLIALALAVRSLPETSWSSLPALIALGFSRAFIEFSTSGLENPLSHLLLIAWASALLRPKRVAFDLLSSAILLNRLDLALLIAPTWLWVMWQRQRAGADRRRLLVHAACASGPLLLWFAFATFYFGFALPNTAYAKLGVKVALSDRIAQGFFYTLLVVSTDPASALVLVVAVIVAWRSGDAVLRALALGIALYVIYVHCIGGDFMAGRFFSAPVVVASLVLLRAKYDRATSFGLAAALGVMGLAGPAAPMWSGAELEGRSGGKVQLSGYRVMDERRFYYPETGLLAADRIREMPGGRFRTGGVKLRGKRGVVVVQLGMRSFIAGPEAALIDPYALADPFLARLPAFQVESHSDWKAGHVKRPLPDGYQATVETGQNQLKDPKLAKLYDQIQLITTGPLWSWQRLQAIWKLNTGQFNKLTRGAQGENAPEVEID
jgi:arabinofuranosyltransferase